MTELIKPPRIYCLQHRHDDKITVDVSDRIWAMLGKAIHVILEIASENEVMTEQRFNVKVLGQDVSMQPDRVERLSVEESLPYWNGEKKVWFPVEDGMALWKLKDFKITNEFAIRMMLDSGKDEWISQVNGYAWGLYQLGFPVVTADIEALMKDWNWVDANVKHVRDYPECQCLSIPIELWPLDKTQQFLESRVQAHLEAEAASDVSLAYCTLEERWATVDRWAVKKIGSDKALPKAANFLNKYDAEQFMHARKDAGQCEVEFRKGESKRCERYCDVKHLCSQYLTEINPAF